jgi:hypothetical protein
MHADSSVLERHAIHSTFTLMQHPLLDILGNLSKANYATVRALFIDLVLATDLARHGEFVKNLRALAVSKGSGNLSPGTPRGGVPSWSSPFLDTTLVDNNLILMVALKWADLAYATKPISVHKKWVKLVTEENYALGDAEKMRKMQLSPMCDRKKDYVATSQLGFMKIVSVPFFSVVANLLDPGMRPFDLMRQNVMHWNSEHMAKQKLEDDSVDADKKKPPAGVLIR